MSKSLKNKTKLNDMVSVKDFGAVGDGVTDDSAAIQAAIDWVESLSNDLRPPIYIPAGAYILGTALEISTTNVRLIGAGRGRSAGGGSWGTHTGGTALQYTGAALQAVPVVAQVGMVKCGVINVGYFGMATTCRGVTIEGMSIYCENAGIGIYCGDDWNTHGYIKDVYISKPTTGIYLQDHCYSLRIEQVEVHGYSQYGIILDDNCHAVDIESCGFTFLAGGSETPTNAILIGQIYQSSMVNINRCQFDIERITDCVVRVNSVCKGFSFTNNYIEIYDAVNPGVTYTADCAISIGGTNGDPLGVTIHGNRFTATATGPAYGVLIKDAVIGASVQGNYFSGFATAGIRLETGCSYIQTFPNYCDTTLVSEQSSTNRNHQFIYQENTFTPTLTFGGGSTGMIGTFSGQYTRIGSVVFFSARIVLTAKGSSTGNAVFGGLPYTSENLIQEGINFQATGGMSGLTGAPVASLGSSGSSLNLYQTSSTGRSVLSDTSFTDTSQINVSGMYTIAR